MSAPVARFARRLAACAVLAAVHGGGLAQPADVRRGEYLAAAGGCASCHSRNADDAAPYAGGARIETPFGVFYGPNITPHRVAGLGRWTDRDFIRAMREGIRPDGQHYYPVFPYTAFTKISDADLRDLWTFLRSLPANGRRNRSHELAPGFGQRFTVAAWKLLYFSPDRFAADPAASDAVNRGAYLVQALGHCDACHTPRTALGGPDDERFLAGGPGPDGTEVPGLTPTTLGKYRDAELIELLITGVTPDGDVLADEMDLVIRNSTSRLTRADLAAIVAYLRALPAAVPMRVDTDPVQLAAADRAQIESFACIAPHHVPPARLEARTRAP
jgi:mono/diheme cytochrome c family protein